VYGKTQGGAGVQGGGELDLNGKLYKKKICY